MNILSIGGCTLTTSGNLLYGMVDRVNLQRNRGNSFVRAVQLISHPLQDVLDLFANDMAMFSSMPILSVGLRDILLCCLL